MKNMEIAKEILENIGWDSMELAIYQDGDTAIRQAGSFGEDEDQVINKIDLSEWTWAGTLANWGVEEVEELTTDQKEKFIKDEIMPML